MSDGERQRWGNGKGDEGGTTTMAHLGTRSTPPTNRMESPPVTRDPRSTERVCNGSARWLRPEATASSVGELAPPRDRPPAALYLEAFAPSIRELGSWLRPEAVRCRLQLGKWGMKLVNREGSRVHLLLGYIDVGAIMF